MKKIALIAVLLMITLGALVLPAAAQQQDLTTLAGYFPADAPLYAGFRIDDAFIQTLDGLAAKVGSVLPGGIMPGSLQELLDNFATQIQPGGTFATTIRPWLGDSAAFGAYTLDQAVAQPYTLAVSITDQNKAEALFDNLLSTSEYAIKDGDGFTVYSPKVSSSSQPTYIFRSDVLLVTTDKALASAGGVVSSKLTDNPNFSAALAMLPESSYYGILYADTPTILNTAMQDRSSSGNAAALSALTSMLSMLKPQAFGLTLLDNRSLTLDVASPLNPDANSALTLNTTHNPVDPTFAQHIPAGTPLVIQGTDLYHNYQAALANLRTLAQTMPETSNMKPQDLETALWGASFLVRGLTGLEMDDALGWMTGDYALYFGFSPAFSDAQSVFAVSQNMPVDFGVTIAATDAAAAQKVYDGLSRSLLNLPAQNVIVKEETLDGGSKALVFTVSSPDMPFPIELLAATGNGVFAFGTRRMVTASINPQHGLDTDSSFTEASKYLLADPNSFLFLSGTSLEPLAHVLTASGNPPDVRQQGKQIEAVLKLISSVSISRSVAADHSGTVARLVWTLPQ